jgi:hypothetical protein
MKVSHIGGTVLNSAGYEAAQNTFLANHGTVTEMPTFLE